MTWIELSSIGQFHESHEKSAVRPQLYFKHSTRCGISKMALKEFEKSGILNHSKADFFLLDLLNYRGISNEIASILGVEHQSPQAILIFKKKAIYFESHGKIDGNNLIEILENIK